MCTKRCALAPHSKIIGRLLWAALMWFEKVRYAWGRMLLQDPTNSVAGATLTRHLPSLRA